MGKCWATKFQEESEWVNEKSRIYWPEKARLQFKVSQVEQFLVEKKSRVWTLGGRWLIFIQALIVPYKLFLYLRVICICSFILILQSNAEYTGDYELATCTVLFPPTPDPSHFIAALEKNRGQMWHFFLKSSCFFVHYYVYTRCFYIPIELNCIPFPASYSIARNSFWHWTSINVEQLQQLSFLVFFLNFSWSIVDLQCSVNFRCTAKWISYTYTYIHSFLDSLHI